MTGPIGGPRERAFQEEVASRAEDLQFLEDKKVHPYVSNVGRTFTAAFDEADFPNGPHEFLEANPHIRALIEELKEEATTEGGQKVLSAAYRLYQGLGDLREEYPHG
jgi:hypothetical protein